MPIDMTAMLCHALRIKVRVAVLKIDSLLKQSTLFEVIVESENFYSVWCLCMPFNRGLQLILVSELAY